MTRFVLDLRPDDLDLVAEACEARAVQRRAAAETFAAELHSAREAGEDTRTRSVRTVEMLGEAGRLAVAAAALRNATPAPVTETDDLEQARAVVEAGLLATAPRRSRPRKAAPAPPVEAPPAPEEVEGPLEGPAAATLANLRRAGAGALGSAPVAPLIDRDAIAAALAAVDDEDLEDFEREAPGA